MEPRWRELPLLKPDREDRSALFREYSANTPGTWPVRGRQDGTASVGLFFDHSALCWQTAVTAQ